MPNECCSCIERQGSKSGFGKSPKILSSLQKSIRLHIRADWHHTIVTCQWWSDSVGGHKYVCISQSGGSLPLIWKSKFGIWSDSANIMRSTLLREGFTFWSCQVVLLFISSENTLLHTRYVVHTYIELLISRKAQSNHVKWCEGHYS